MMKRIILVLLVFNAWAFSISGQGFTPYRCANHEQLKSDSEHEHRGPCINGFNSFLSNHREDMIPTGATRTLKIKTNVILMQNDQGEGNFSPSSNTTHQAFLNAVFDNINNRLLSIHEDCSCSSNPATYTTTNMEFVPTFIEIQDNFGWDHKNDAQNTVYNSGDKAYLNYCNNLAASTPGYEDGFNVIVTTDGIWYDAFMDDPDTPLWETNYDHYYSGYWYSSFPKYDLEHPAMWHAPDWYLWYINCFEHCGGQWWVDNDYLDFSARVFIHEYGHYFGLFHTSCAENIMTPGGGQNERNALTGCQIREMYETIMTKNLRKYVVCEDVIDHEIDIVNDETWSNNIMVYNDIYIKDGGKLTITCELHMQPDTRIVVERGGELVIDKGLLTGCGDFWKGITVEGDVAQGQSNAGTLRILNSSIIENASVAVDMQQTHRPWPELEGYFGGYVEAENSTFIDCKRAAAFMRFAQGGQKDQSYFLNCTFDNLKYGITDWSDDGVLIDNCHFSNIEEYAVHAYDAEVIVRNGCTFDNMPEGVYIKTSFPNIFSSKIGDLSFAPNDFQATIHGVYSDANDNIEYLDIQNNNFLGGDHGVHLNGSQHFFVHKNDFIDQNVSGATPQDGGSNPTEISENTITSALVGSQAAFDNIGLEYYENCFSFNGPSDIRVVNGSIFPIQGGPGNTPDNCFSHGFTKAIDNTLGSTQLVYFSGTNDMTNCLYPKNSLNTQIIEEQGGINPNNCGSTIVPSPVNVKSLCYYGLQGKENIKNKIIEIEALIEEIKLDNSISKFMKKYWINKYTRCLKYLIKKYGKDVLIDNTPTPGDKNDVIDFYTGRPEFDSKILAFGILMSNKNYVQALQLLNSLTPQTEEESDFIFTQNVNIEYLINKGTFQLTNKVQSELQEIAEKVQPKSGYARALFEELTGDRIYLPIPEEDKGKLSSQHEIESKDYTFAPNPVSNTLILDLIDDSEKKITFYDATGRLIHEMNSIVSRENVSVGEWENGIYFFKIQKLNNSEVFTSKFIVIN